MRDSADILQKFPDKNIIEANTIGMPSHEKLLKESLVVMTISFYYCRNRISKRLKIRKNKTHNDTKEVI